MQQRRVTRSRSKRHDSSNEPSTENSQSTRLNTLSNSTNNSSALNEQQSDVLRTSQIAAQLQHLRRSTRHHSQNVNSSGSMSSNRRTNLSGNRPPVNTPRSSGDGNRRQSVRQTASRRIPRLSTIQGRNQMVTILTPSQQIPLSNNTLTVRPSNNETRANSRRRQNSTRRSTRHDILINEHRNRLRNQNFQNHSDTDVELVHGPPSLSFLENPLLRIPLLHHPTSPVYYPDHMDYIPMMNQESPPSMISSSANHDVYVVDSSDDFPHDWIPVNFSFEDVEDESYDFESIITNSTEQFIPRTPPISEGNGTNFLNIPNDHYTSPGGINPEALRNMRTGGARARLDYPNPTPTGSIQPPPSDFDDEILIFPNGDNNSNDTFRPRQRLRPNIFNEDNYNNVLHTLLHMHGVPMHGGIEYAFLHNHPYRHYGYFRNFAHNPRRQQIIQSLHSTTYEKSLNSYGDISCGICLEKYEPTCVVLELYPCKHIFHKSCVMPWFNTDITCPYCRTKIIEPPIVI